MASLVSAASKWGLIRPFLLILLLHSLALYLFTRGFLLTRTELSAFSHCSDISQSPCSPPTAADPDCCWTRPAVDRVVIIVLDALRFDFVAPSAFFEEAKPWMDKLRVLQRLASANPSSARIFKAIADPPTTSLQRLKGLTTGGLPTFIDVGNSFGAPAIVEDNLLYQLGSNGKKVLMMGDDTWLQLFPDHFDKSYPYPSFNVKDLHTVDDGVIEHLLPSLHKKDWDVLIAHFLGVDHAGHIYGVDSTPMIQKLEQYNDVLEAVIEVLQNQSGPGGLHENTLLLVMGDHGQTLNGDHGGGTAEEVETSLFAMSLRSPPASVSSILDDRFCKLDLDGEKICYSTIQQLDFAATVAALIGIPFPFGSIGRVNPELFALCAGTWNGQKNDAKICQSCSSLEEWMQSYANALCINSWQVKRYLDLYSSTSVIGFPSEDLRHVSELYSQAQGNWSNTAMIDCLFENCISSEKHDDPKSTFKIQIDAYSSFMESIAKLARSAWTEFNLLLMGIGLCIMLLSLCVHLLAIRRVNVLCQSYQPAHGSFDISFRSIYSYLLVAIRGVSFLSNSYILEEGRVANFLLATTSIVNIQFSFSKGKFVNKDILFLLLNAIIRLGIEFGASKQTGSTSLNINLSSILGINKVDSALKFLIEIFPFFALLLLVFLLFKCTYKMQCNSCIKKFVILGSILSYMLVGVHLISENRLMSLSGVVRDFGKNFVPRLVYAVGFGQLALLVLSQLFDMKKKSSNSSQSLSITTISMLSVWSPTILLLLGHQGPFVGLILISGGWCILGLQKLSLINTNGTSGGIFVDPISTTQWSLLAVCLFFYTGHWCTFDGLRYGAAFIGFDHFNIISQGVLLAIDTFGVSHILPILSLPFNVSQEYSKNQANVIPFLNLTQVFLSYGFIAAFTTTMTVICVTIQRRHLMVWGLFAPKYVFDVLGLILTDVLILLASLCYY